MTPWPRLRACEWILLSFFSYIAVVSHWFPTRPNLHNQPLVILAVVMAFFFILARLAEQVRFGKAVSYCRDFIPIVVTVVAFREMEYFLPLRFDRHLEDSWITWDRMLLDTWHVRAGIETLGSALPSFLELCYVLVYGLPFYCVASLYLQQRRQKVDLFFTIYLTGTLIAYSLFPFFPSRPPRLLFPNLDQPAIQTALRQFNMAILNAATIHVGVFPSAHVSSAFSAAWGMFLVVPKRKVFGWTLLVYAICVSIATIYGRYHYTADVAAGFGVSLIAALVALSLHRWPAKRDPESTLIVQPSAEQAVSPAE